MSKAIAVAKPSSESAAAESQQPLPHETQSRKQKQIDAPRQSKRLPTRRTPLMIISHGRSSHSDCRAGLIQIVARHCALAWSTKASNGPAHQSSCEIPPMLEQADEIMHSSARRKRYVDDAESAVT